MEHLTFLAFAVLYPVVDYFFYNRRFKKRLAIHTQKARILEYRTVIAWLWALCILAAAVWFLQDRDPADLGIVLHLNWQVFAALTIMIVGLVYVYYVYRATLLDAEALHNLKQKFDGIQASNFLPNNRQEFSWFVWVSLSAGICEELLYRGFLIWYLSQYLTLVPAIILSSVFFGFAHAYQGWKGILQTGTTGLIMALIYTFTGSLWIPIALHIIIDIYSGLLGWLAYDPKIQDNSGGKPVIQ